MGEINWEWPFLGGLLAGMVCFVLMALLLALLNGDWLAVMYAAGFAPVILWIIS